MKDKILSIFSDILNMAVSETTSFNGVSSLRVLQIIMALDEEGITIPLEKIAKIKSVSDLISFAEMEG